MGCGLADAGDDLGVLDDREVVGEAVRLLVAHGLRADDGDRVVADHPDARGRVLRDRGEAGDAVAARDLGHEERAADGDEERRLVRVRARETIRSAT